MGDINQFIANVEAQLGKPYCFGGVGPSCFDCSGLMQTEADAAGFSIPRTTEEQFAALPLVVGGQPGDIIFFDVAGDTQAPPNHNGMCTDVGCTQMIHAPHTGTVVRRASTSGVGTIMGIGRLPQSGPPTPPPGGYAQGWTAGINP